MDTEIQKAPKTSSQAAYSITVSGALTEHWTEFYSGTSVALEYSHDGNVRTTLTCQVRDQAELVGILNQLSNLNLTLLQVVLIKNEGE